VKSKKTAETKQTQAQKPRAAKVPATSVAALLDTLGHPLRADIDWLRDVILQADPAVVEEVKWNAPSFRTTEFFATMHLRAPDALQLVLHTGAKAKGKALPRTHFPDPHGLMRWLADDRCILTLGAGAQLRARREAIVAILRAWLAAG
jgi:hypothetical protein